MKIEMTDGEVWCKPQNIQAVVVTTCCSVYPSVLYILVLLHVSLCCMMIRKFYEGKKWL